MTAPPDNCGPGHGDDRGTGTRRPNVLVVMTDQQRPDSCGVFGQRLPVTPVLDGLAADGVAFDEAFTVQPADRAAQPTGGTGGGEGGGGGGPGGVGGPGAGGDARQPDSANRRTSRPCRLIAR